MSQKEQVSLRLASRRGFLEASGAAFFSGFLGAGTASTARTAAVDNGWSMRAIRRCGFLLVLAGFGLFSGVAATEAVAYEIQLETVLEPSAGGEWFQPRPAPIPGAGEAGKPAVVMVVMQVLGSDYFTGLSSLRTLDLGKTWSEPSAVPALAWRQVDDGTPVVHIGVCDFQLGWHAPSQRVLGIGHTVRYTKKGFAGYGYRRDTAYAVYDPAGDTWSPWRVLELPETDDDSYFFNGAHGQWLVEPDGTILLPIYAIAKGLPFHCRGMVVRCRFDGQTLSYVEKGQEMTVPERRGLYEKSIVKHQGRYYLTMRNDLRGYVTSSGDGLNFAPVRPWTFDDGAELGSYNTQQKWVSHGDRLFLVYTRRGLDNDEIMRHRAPLVMAQVDTERLSVLRDTERVIVPKRGKARFGNFDATRITDNETWITVGGGGPAYCARILFEP